MGYAVWLLANFRTTYQIALCDWVLVVADSAITHIYPREVKDIDSPQINESAASKGKVVVVSLMCLQIAFGLLAQRALSFSHSG